MKWEYRTETLSWTEAKKKGVWTSTVEQDKVNAFLNEKGNEGWELAAALALDSNEICFFMKRPH